jgi:anti-sigma B factor antagonist
MVLCSWSDADRAIVEVAGDLDFGTAPRLREVLLELHQAARDLVIVEMSAADFMDSSGLGALLSGVKRAAAAGGVLVLAGAPERVLRVLRVTGVVQVLPVFATLDEALAHLDEMARR